MIPTSLLVGLAVFNAIFLLAIFSGNISNLFQRKDKDLIGTVEAIYLAYVQTKPEYIVFKSVSNGTKCIFRERLEFFIPDSGKPTLTLNNSEYEMNAVTTKHLVQFFNKIRHRKIISDNADVLLSLVNKESNQS